MIVENVGVDIVKKIFVVCLSYLLLDCIICVNVIKEFNNSVVGFEFLLVWVFKYC